MVLGTKERQTMTTPIDSFPSPAVAAVAAKYASYLYLEGENYSREFVFGIGHVIWEDYNFEEFCVVPALRECEQAIAGRPARPIKAANIDELLALRQSFVDLLAIPESQRKYEEDTL